MPPRRSAAGLVARVVPAGELLTRRCASPRPSPSKSQPVVAMAKEAVNVAFETTLAEGLRFERRLFYATFATDDRSEGMAAFAEKRIAEFHQPLRPPVCRPATSG